MKGKLTVALLAAAIVPLADGKKAKADAVTINVYSQRDPAWKDDALPPSTIEKLGCYMTCVAMAEQVSPKDLNKYLIQKGGYDATGKMDPLKAAAYDGTGGVQYVGSGNLPGDAASVRRGIARGAVYIVYSRRFAPKSDHWVIVFVASDTQAYYIDPYDLPGTGSRRVGAADGWVNFGNTARIFTKPR